MCVARGIAHSASRHTTQNAVLDVCVKTGVLTSVTLHLFWVGIAVWELMTGRKPFVEVSNWNLTRHIVDRAPNILDIPDHTPDVLRRILLCCWSRDPHKRPTMAEIVKMLLSYNSNSKSDAHRRAFYAAGAFVTDLILTTAINCL